MVKNKYEKCTSIFLISQHYRLVFGRYLIQIMARLVAILRFSSISSGEGWNCN